MFDFIKDNEAFFVFMLILISIAVLVILCLVMVKSNRLVKSLLVNRFKVIDMFEKNTDDDAHLYTFVISNNSMNAVSVASVGFEHNGDYFNYRSECKQQLENQNGDLVILPRGSIKLRLRKDELESAIFSTSKTKRFGKLKVYIIGLGGEAHTATTKIIGKKMAESYHDFYAYNEPSIISAYVTACNDKLLKGARLSLCEKIKYFFWNKRLIASNEKIKEVADSAAELAKGKSKSIKPEISSEEKIKSVLNADTLADNQKFMAEVDKKDKADEE